ncbi:hypothetical protein [Streptomyces sp. CAI-24]|nr:hypothetical protein [Streptomyces sp. CAI-24]
MLLNTAQDPLSYTPAGSRPVSRLAVPTTIGCPFAASVRGS